MSIAEYANWVSFSPLCLSWSGKCWWWPLCEVEVVFHVTKPVAYQSFFLLTTWVSVQLPNHQLISSFSHFMVVLFLVTDYPAYIDRPPKMLRVISRHNHFGWLWNSRTAKNVTESYLDPSIASYIALQTHSIPTHKWSERKASEPVFHPFSTPWA